MQKVIRAELLDYIPATLCEKKLAHGVIERALQDLDSGEEHIQRDAKGWFFRDDCVPLSFYWWANMFDDIDVKYLAAVIRQKITDGFKFEKCRLQK